MAAQAQEFAIARQWERFDTPRNLILALLSEVGELADLVQWKDDHEDFTNNLSPEDLNAISQELADVSIYLMRLATLSNVLNEVIENALDQE